MEATSTPVRRFDGLIPDHKAIPLDHPKVAALKWARQHEKKRLRAYLKGHTHFGHGRDLTINGWEPRMYPVTQSK